MARKFLFDGITTTDVIGIGAVVVAEPFINQLIDPMTSKLNWGIANIQVDDVVKVILGGIGVSKVKNEYVKSASKALVVIALARIFSGLYSKIKLTTTTTTVTQTSTGSSSANLV